MMSTGVTADRAKPRVLEPLVSKRDPVAVEKWMGVCHDQSGAHSSYDMSTPEAAIFTSNATHALTPETIIGPYFVAGEYIRSDVTENEPGVPIHLDVQFIDINTCESVPNMLVDMWHANATGVYSGVVGSGGLNTTFLRGIQVTDHDGVVQFDSIYPGHYFGRTQHIHVVSRRGGKILSNGTYTGGVVNHIGQLYFDQELNDNIRSMLPYRNNWMPLTTNRADFLTAQEASESYDPFVQYVMLSDDARDGLLMWITIGINATADYNKLAYAAATWKEGGGVASPPQRFPFPPPNGTNGTNITGMPPMPFPPAGGFPGFPTSSAQPAQATPQPWGPCNA